MVEIVKSNVFDAWFDDLRDVRAQRRIQARIRRLSTGNVGDAKSVGEGISEMRIDYGPGYRVYFLQRGIYVAILLCGGDKRTQEADIKQAKAIAKQWRE